MENELLCPVEYGNCRRKLVERAGMGLCLLVEGGPHGFEFRNIRGHSGRTRARRRFDDFEHPARAGNDRRSPPMPNPARLARRRARLACLMFDKLNAAHHRGLLILGFDRAGIGGIDPAQLAAAIAQPCGVGGCVEKGAQGLDLADRSFLQFLQTGGLAAIAGHVPDSQDGNAGDGPSLDFEMAPVENS